MMRILFITPYLITGGAEKIVYELCTGLKRRGMSVAVASTGGYFADLLKQNCIPIHHIKMLDKRSPVPLFRAALALSRLLRSERFNVINSQSFITAVVAFLAIKLSRSDAKLVFTIHGSGKESYYKVMGLTLNWMVDQVITVCNDIRERLIERNIRPDKITTIHNGIDLERFPFIKRPGLSDEIRIGVVARLIKRKGHFLLLESLQGLKKKFKNKEIKLYLVGDGPIKEDLDKATHEMGLKRRVSLLGDCKDIPQILSQMDIFVLPSFFEGCPLSIIEALSSGLPVIATAVNGVPEIIKNGFNGLLVEPGNVKALTGAIARVIDDEGLHRNLVKNSHLSVKKRFSLNVMVDSYAGKFRHTLNPTY